MNPHVDQVREALALVANGYQRQHVSDDVQFALTWAWENGLVESVTLRLTPKGEAYRKIIDSTAGQDQPFETVSSWAQWLRSLEPIEAIKIGSELIGGETVRRLAAVIDEITYAQTTAGGGEMTQVELASLLGISAASIARRAGRHLKAQKKITWRAVLAPVDVAGLTPQRIAQDCVVSVLPHAPLFDASGRAIGRVLTASVVEGYVVVSGSLLAGERLPAGLPTFDLNGQPDLVIEDPFQMIFKKVDVRSVRCGSKPCWDDPNIAFC